MDLCQDRDIPGQLGSWNHMASINGMHGPVHDALAAEVTIKKGSR